MTKTTPKTSKKTAATPKKGQGSAMAKAVTKTSQKTVTRAKKSSVRKSGATKVTSKKATKAPVTAKKDLQSALSSLETRMKRADTLTRKSVKALEASVLALDARTRKNTTQSKSALTRKVNQLSAKLTDMVAQTQTEVNAELKTALKNPTFEKLQLALARAEQRLSIAEQSQATAISKVNRHLSSIAMAVDARIEEEAKARLASVAALKAESENAQALLTQRIDTIEADTAHALISAGDKIEELSAELTRRGEASEISIREKVSEIALQTQTEFETYRAGLERRIDAITQNSSSPDTKRLERSIAGLTARLDGLEYAVVNAPAALAASDPHTVTAQGGNIDVGVPQPPQLSLVGSQTAPLAPTVLDDAFTSMPSYAAAQETMPNPYLEAERRSAQAQGRAVVTEEKPSGPIEFNPSNYHGPKNHDGIQISQPHPVAAPITPHGQQVPLPHLTETPAPPPLANIDLDNTAYTESTYADPAYAEVDPTMDRMRIGDDAAPRFNLPKLSGRNLRVAALATGVAVVGLVAAKGVFGGTDTVNAPQLSAVNAQTTNSAPVSIPAPDTSVAPIGDYADNKAVEIPPASEAANTLNAAAKSGDKVAQFQLGLSYLEQGRTNEGVDLIRKSANQNQPAAQYRLAKLYEIGEGVTQDSEMARQLTERAAANGNRIAMHDLALYYAEGRGGVSADLPVAAKWFEKAAERGVVDSQFNLGVLFESGQGLPKNINDAFVWYSIAAEQGDQFAKTRVDVLSTTLDQADLVSAAARAKAFKPVKIDEAANGIFRNVAWAKTNKLAGEEASQVKQAQTMLTELGYEIGGADGSVGPKTRAAIMSFERANSLPETGRINTALIERLELATGA